MDEKNIQCTVDSMVGAWFRNNLIDLAYQIRLVSLTQDFSYIEEVMMRFQKRIMTESVKAI